MRRIVRGGAAGICLALLLAVSVAHAGAARARILYVNGANPACSDADSGQAAFPFCTIGAAAAKVRAGQTVQVAAGRYQENVHVVASGTRRRPIVFAAARRGRVVVRGQTNGFTVVGRRWVTIKGFTVTGVRNHGISVQRSSFIKILRNRVSNAGQRKSGITGAGIWLAETRASLVAGNVADDNTYAGIELTEGSTRNVVRGNKVFANASGFNRRAPGIRLSGSPHNTIRGNITRDNEDSGIECFSGGNELIVENVSFDNKDHGIDNHACSGGRLLGNTVYDNTAAGINVEANSIDTTIANNISVDNGINSPRTRSDIRVDASSTAGTSMNSDLVYVSGPTTVFIWNSTIYLSLQALQAATGQESQGLYGDPRFVNPSKGNFRLRAGSPAIDSADSPLPGWPRTDIQGHRPYDDRGAYEYRPRKH